MARAALDLGTILVIANPAAQSGRGAQGALLVEKTLREQLGAGASFEVRLTQGPGHATELAGSARGFGTVIALGGDGLVHEVVNGLMRIDGTRRPRLAVVALGSGNDYARALGMARNDPRQAVAHILGGQVRRADLGLVNGTYFDNTLSFGIDADIAAETMERRKKSGAHGMALFAASGLDAFMHRMRAYPYTAQIVTHGDDGTEKTESIAGREIIFAVQVGPTYGGGFKVAPQASPFDGLLDLCYSVKEPPKLWALALFLSAKYGLHVHSSAIETRRVKRLTVEFTHMAPPAQVDGEVFGGTRFDIQCVPGALEVVVPA